MENCLQLDLASEDNDKACQVKLQRNLDMFSKDLKSILHHSFKEETFTDVHLYCKTTLSGDSCSWTSIRANCSVLAASSPYMKKILSHINLVEYHITMDNFSFEEVCALIQYSYTGEVEIHLRNSIDFKHFVGIFELGIAFDEIESEVDEENVNSIQDKDWCPSQESGDSSFQPELPASHEKSQTNQGICNNQNISTSDRVCDVCGKCFARPALMLNHRRIHTGEKPFTCTICHKSYREKSHLTRHQRSHSENARPFHCDICDKSFANHFYLTQHRLTHSGYKRLLCSTCGYRCFQASDLNKHMRTHTGEKPYVCEYCGKGFTQKVSCVKHQQAIHKNNETTMQSLPSFESTLMH